jgi:hypothetical protein
MNTDIKDEKMVNCIGLIDLFLEKNPTEDKEMFIKTPEALQGFLDRLMDHPAVLKDFPDNINFLFTDIKYADNINKLSFIDFNIITNEDRGWVLVRVKRQKI